MIVCLFAHYNKALIPQRQRCYSVPRALCKSGQLSKTLVNAHKMGKKSKTRALYKRWYSVGIALVER